MMHPKAYVKTMWRTIHGGDIKDFVFNSNLPTQSEFITNPSSSIRLEYWDSDMGALGITGYSHTFSPPQKDLCASTSTYIRRLYNADYELGDYE